MKAENRVAIDVAEKPAPAELSGERLSQSKRSQSGRDKTFRVKDIIACTMFQNFSAKRLDQPALTIVRCKSVILLCDDYLRV